MESEQFCDLIIMDSIHKKTANIGGLLFIQFQFRDHQLTRSQIPGWSLVE